VKDFHTDSLLSDEVRASFSTSIEETTRQARVSLLRTLTESKLRACQLHELRSGSDYVLAKARDRMFDSLHQMGHSQESIASVFLPDITRGLCHLRFSIDESHNARAWSVLQDQRKKSKAVSASDAVMDGANSLAPADLSESVLRLVNRTVEQKLASMNRKFKNISVSRGSSGGSRRSGSGSGSSRSGSSGSSRGSASSSSSSGKGNRPSAARGPSKGRVIKSSSAAPKSSAPRRLAPAPSPFKQLKGKGKGTH
jgi:uncharacterized membrane protein YgcG